MNQANTAHLLDDFLERTPYNVFSYNGLICEIEIEHLPNDLRTQLAILAEKDSQFEESRKQLFKKRNLYLRAEEKGLDASLQATLLRKTEKEHAKLVALIDEKIDIEMKLASLVEQHLGKLENELVNKASIRVEYPHASLFNHIPETTDVIHPNITNMTSRPTRSSPKKRTTLHDEPIDPNEPVYCYCRQVSFGDMIACDNTNCSIEWFHYACVGLHAPPKGKWYCKDCNKH